MSLEISVIIHILLNSKLRDQELTQVHTGKSRIELESESDKEDKENLAQTFQWLPT